MEIKFYFCHHCKNILVPSVDSGVTPSCCGEKMELLQAGSVDAALEKHVPAIELDADGHHFTVNIGSVPHPMTEEHYIQFVVVAHGSRVGCHKFAPGEEPSLRFSIKDNAVPITVYEYCNLHGLWKTEV